MSALLLHLKRIKMNVGFKVSGCSCQENAAPGGPLGGMPSGCSLRRLLSGHGCLVPGPGGCLDTGLLLRNLVSQVAIMGTGSLGCC